MSEKIKHIKQNQVYQRILKIRCFTLGTKVEHEDLCSVELGSTFNELRLLDSDKIIHLRLSVMM